MNTFKVTELLTTSKTNIIIAKKSSEIIDLRGHSFRPIYRETVWYASGKPSTWFPPGRLVEQKNIDEKKATFKNDENI